MKQRFFFSQTHTWRSKAAREQNKLSKTDERCGYVTGFDGLTDCQSLIFDVLPSRQ